MSLLDVRRNMRTIIAAGLQDLIEVNEHGGSFSLDELKRFAQRVPCVVLCSLGISSVDYDGEPVANTDWGVFIIAKDKPGLKRDEAALLLVSKALTVINQTQRWGFDTGVHMMTGLKAANLYNANLDKTGIALWAITFTQGYDISVLDIDTLSNLLLYESTISISSNPNTPTGDDVVHLPAYGS